MIGDAIGIENDRIARLGRERNLFVFARIEQVLGNLLSNAIKYSPGGGQVQVSLTVRGGVAEILVSDRGVGLDADELAKLFDPFQRMGRPEAIPGTGLGLSVVKRIVEAHGGEVGVRSARGRGTTFTITLPALETASEPERKTACALNCTCCTSSRPTKACRGS